MATKSFDRNIVIKNASAIKMIKDEMEKLDFANFSTGKKLEKISEKKRKLLAEQILKKFQCARV